MQEREFTETIYGTMRALEGWDKKLIGIQAQYGGGMRLLEATMGGPVIIYGTVHIKCSKDFSGRDAA